MYKHGDLRIAVFPDPAFQENGMLLWLDGRPECWIVDPGFEPQPRQLLRAVAEQRLTPVAIVLTHAHVDHIAGIDAVRQGCGAPLFAPRGETALLADAAENLSAFMGLPVTVAPAERTIGPGDTLWLGASRWQVLDVAGHSPGGLAYFCAESGEALVGDAVFREGIGRTDFPHSDHARLIRNIREHLLTLPDATVLYPGHGPRATVADIRDDNQTLREALESW
jgi:hydroxyacylglutathione hydrolase